MEAVVERPGACAWILADEVYAGAERTAEEQTPTFYGLYDKVPSGSLSSTASGLRSAGPSAWPNIDELWARHEYLTLSATMLSNHPGRLRPLPRRPGPASSIGAGASSAGDIPSWSGRMGGEHEGSVGRACGRRPSLS